MPRRKRIKDDDKEISLNRGKSNKMDNPIEVNTDYDEEELGEFEYVYVDTKTVRRFKRYTDKVTTDPKNKHPHKRGYKFKGFNLRFKSGKTKIIGLEFNNKGTYFYIPECSERGIYSVLDKKYVTLRDLKKDMIIVPNTHMCSLYPNIFYMRHKYKITNDVLHLYFDCTTEKNILNLIKYIIFHQAKSIYRKTNEKQKLKNI